MAEFMFPNVVYRASVYRTEQYFMPNSFRCQYSIPVYCEYILIQFFLWLRYVNIFIIYFLLAANVDDADGSLLGLMTSFLGEDTKVKGNSDTGKNNQLEIKYQRRR